MNKNMRLGILLIAVFGLSLFAQPVTLSQAQQTNEACPVTVFDIDLLSPNTNPQRNAWSALMEEEFPKACIGVDQHLSTDWTTIAARTWAYDVDSTDDGLVPNYDDGGFDVLFVGYSNPSAPIVTVDDLYHSNQFAELGGFNFYHFNNATFDTLHDNMVQSLDPTTFNGYAEDIQQILYEEQPSLTLLYPESVWAYDDGLTLTEGDLFGLSLAGVDDEWANYGIADVDELVYAHSYDVSEFIPHIANSYIAAQYQSAIWQGMYSRNLDTKAWEPLIAASMPTVEANGTTVTIDIRNDVTFADGELLDADDVVESFKMMMDPDWGHISIASIVTYFGNSTLGGGNITVDHIVSKVDNNTIRFNLKAPYFDIPALFSYAIFPTHTWGTQENPMVANYDYNGEMVNNTNGKALYGFGTGPFQYESIQGTSGNIQLKAVTDWWGGTVASNFISFTQYDTKAPALTALADGTVHIIDSQLKPSLGEIEDIAGITYDTVIDFGWQEIAINNQHPIIGTGIDTPLGKEDPSRAGEAARYVRQAMSHAIPRQTIIDEIAEGLASPGITAGWAPGTVGYSGENTAYEYSIAKAKELLIKAGYDLTPADDGGGFLGSEGLFLVSMTSVMVALVIYRRRA